MGVYGVYGWVYGCMGVWVYGYMGIWVYVAVVPLFRVIVHSAKPSAKELVIRTILK